MWVIYYLIKQKGSIFIDNIMKPLFSFPSHASSCLPSPICWSKISISEKASL